jgi:hypothetical protein
MKRTTYFSRDVESALDIEGKGVESFSGRVGFMICAAAAIAKEECPPLPLNVWLALADADRGTAHDYEQGVESVVSGMTMNLVDYEQDNQFDTDPLEWARNIRAMPLSQQFSIFEVVRRFWRRSDEASASKDYREFLEKIGANVAP